MRSGVKSVKNQMIRKGKGERMRSPNLRLCTCFLAPSVLVSECDLFYEL